MKKLKVFSILLLGLSFLTLASCGGDDEDAAPAPANPLVGDWSFTNDQGGWTDEYRFEADLTGEYRFEDFDGELSRTDFTYEYTASAIVFTYEDNINSKGTLETVSYEVDGSELIITFDDGTSYIYTK